MNIARMNVKIEIQKNTAVIDRYGNHTNSWLPYLSCFATVSGETPKEEADTGLIVDDSRLDFTIRYCDAVSAVTSTGFRVIFNGELYDILGVNHMGFRNKGVKLLCRKERR